eukprot:GEMP01038383.1.p1 GENE.GEMP01038383.1~~GEMP01038383.1.p1  ORF type:complete len:328 (+),score=52.20 GEMP01038383.1:58-1041(+)
MCADAFDWSGICEPLPGENIFVRINTKWVKATCVEYSPKGLIIERKIQPKKLWQLPASNPWRPRGPDTPVTLEHVANFSDDKNRQFSERWWRTLSRFGLIDHLTEVDQARLRRYDEARRWCASKVGDHEFWAKISKKRFDRSNIPESALAAIDIAKEQGATKFYSLGVYVSSSLCPGGGRGLFSLIMRTPRELVGVFQGLWVWPQKRYRKSIHRYAVTYRHGDVTGLIDPCWGKDDVDIERSPFALINEPPEGRYANCITESIFLEEEPQAHARHQVWVITGLPVLPNEELFYHYGDEYRERDYTPGLACPDPFYDMEPATELHPLL